MATTMIPADLPLTLEEIELFKTDRLVIEGELYDRLFNYFLNSGEMPYRVAKARDADPYTWIDNQLTGMLS